MVRERPVRRQGLHRPVLAGVLVMLCLLIAGTGHPAPAVTPPAVLLLNSYHRGLSWTDDITAEIEESLHGRAELHVEYMDTKRHPTGQSDGSLRDFYRRKYAGRRFAVVIVSDNNALQFVKRHRANVFPDTPIVFCGINHFTGDLIDESGFYTGVVEKTSPAETFDLMRTLHPAVKRCVVIGDATTTGRAELSAARATLGGQRAGAAIIYWENLATPELTRRLRELDPDTDAVLLTVFNRDAAGSYYSYEESGRFITEAAPCPVYGLWDFYLGTGVVGGCMASARAQGQEAARLAVQVLQGVASAEIVIQRESPNQVLFDGSRLSEMGIRLSVLPSGATVLESGEPVYRVGDQEKVHLGVLAKRGRAVCRDEWGATADYLTRRLPGYRFELVPLDFSEVPRAVTGKEIEFLITNPAQYAELDAAVGLGALATLKNLRMTRICTVFGGVILCRSDRHGITSLEDLRGRRFAAVDSASFGGWRMAWRELKRAGIEPERDFKELRFSGTHDAVVRAVADGSADAGTVRTDTLERMEAEGLIRLEDFRILHRLPPVEQFPFDRSTELYPEWPLAQLPHVSPELAQLVAGALIGMSPDSDAARASYCAGWTVPLSYQPVHECLKDLRVGPYRDLGRIRTSEVLWRYRVWVAAALGIMLMLAVILVHPESRIKRTLFIFHPQVFQEQPVSGH